MSFFAMCFISGWGHEKPNLIVGGRVFVWPWVQKINRISLNLLMVNINSPRIYTKFGVPISVTGIAQVKIESNPTSLHKACQQLLGKSEKEIINLAMETLEGHQRAIMGTMTVEEIFQERKKFSTAVFEVASRDLINMGINVVSYTIKEITDDCKYLDSLGLKRTAEVERDAIIGQAESNKDQTIRQSRATQETLVARFATEILVAKAVRDKDVAVYTYDIEVKSKQAQADLAYPLQQAKTQQKITNEKMSVLVVEKQKAIEVMEQEIVRRERELDGTIRRPALAERFRLTTMAEANKNRVIMEASAEAESIRAKGEAEAYAICAKATAEAEAMQKKAEAWAEYKEAALLDMLLQVLPRVVHEVSAPLCRAEKITMVAGDGDIGASRLAGEVLSIVDKLPAMIKTMTGVDITKTMSVGKK